MQYHEEAVGYRKPSLIQRYSSFEEACIDRLDGGKHQTVARKTSIPLKKLESEEILTLYVAFLNPKVNALSASRLVNQ